MTDRLTELKLGTEAAVLTGPGTTTPELRQSIAAGRPPEELLVLVEKIRRHAYKVTDADLAALRTRFSEDQLFEIVVSAAFGAANDRLRAGLKALGDA
jgi:alkylhydroperoxidase family enzyme